MTLLHFSFDMSDYISLRIPTRVLAAFIFLQGIFRSCSHALHIRTWRRRFHHLRGLSLQEFSDLFQSGNTVYVMLMPLTKKRGWHYRCGALLQRKSFYMLDPLLFQFILVKMLDCISIVCYSVESSAMQSSCYITFVLVEIYMMPSSFHFIVSPIYNKLEPPSIPLYIEGSRS